MQLNTEIPHNKKLGCDHGGISLELWPQKIYPDYSILLLHCTVYMATEVTDHKHKKLNDQCHKNLKYYIKGICLPQVIKCA